MPRKREQDKLDALREAKRDGYALALMETGPRALSDEQAAKFAEYYKAKAEQRFP